MEFFWACSIIHYISPKKCSGHNYISLCKGNIQLCPNLSHELHNALLGKIYAHTKELHLPRLTFSNWYDFELKV
jgi:hypothetical protein